MLKNIHKCMYNRKKEKKKKFDTRKKSVTERNNMKKSYGQKKKSSDNKYGIDIAGILKIYGLPEDSRGLPEQKQKNLRNAKTAIKRMFEDSFPGRMWGELRSSYKSLFAYIIVKDKMFNNILPKHLDSPQEVEKRKKAVEEEINQINSKKNNPREKLTVKNSKIASIISCHEVARKWFYNESDSPEKKEEGYKIFVAVCKKIYPKMAENIPSKEEWLNNPQTPRTYKMWFREKQDEDLRKWEEAKLEADAESKADVNSEDDVNIGYHVESEIELELKDYEKKVRELRTERFNLRTKKIRLREQQKAFKEELKKYEKFSPDAQRIQKKLEELSEKKENLQEKLDDLQEKIDIQQEDKEFCQEQRLKQLNEICKTTLSVFNIALNEGLNLKVNIDDIVKCIYLSDNDAPFITDLEDILSVDADDVPTADASKNASKDAADDTADASKNASKDADDDADVRATIEAFIARKYAGDDVATGKNAATGKDAATGDDAATGKDADADDDKIVADAIDADGKLINEYNYYNEKLNDHSKFIEGIVRQESPKYYQDIAEKMSELLCAYDDDGKKYPLGLKADE